jgi:acyl-CoA thioesterase I
MRDLARIGRAVGLVLALLAAGCGGRETTRSTPRTSPPAPAMATGTPPSAPEKAPPTGPSSSSGDPLVVFLGDSLTAGYGLDEVQAYPPLVKSELERRGLPVRIVNAGVSGDTSAGGLERLDWLLAQKPAIVVVELGGNDALRGQPLSATETNLRAIVERCLAAGTRVLLVGMKIPPNYGPEYTRGFEAIYPELARETGVDFLPFLLEGVGGRPELNQADGIHPTAEGQKIVARTVADALTPMVRQVSRPS